jgi:hypothetical protein
MGFVAEQLLIRASLSEFAHPVPRSGPTHTYIKRHKYFSFILV